MRPSLRRVDQPAASPTPLIAFGFVSDRDAHRVLVLGAILLAGGLSIMTWLRATALRASSP